jgi:hypothetical protein
MTANLIEQSLICLLYLPLLAVPAGLLAVAAFSDRGRGEAHDAQ